MASFATLSLRSSDIELNDSLYTVKGSFVAWQQYIMNTIGGEQKPQQTLHRDCLIFTAQEESEVAAITKHTETAFLFPLRDFWSCQLTETKRPCFGRGGKKKKGIFASSFSCSRNNVEFRVDWQVSIEMRLKELPVHTLTGDKACEMTQVNVRTPCRMVFCSTGGGSRVAKKGLNHYLLPIKLSFSTSGACTNPRWYP